MFTEFYGWALLIHIAALTQIAGYFFRDQIILRVLLLIGTLFYCLYYILIPATPLWDAVFWSAVMGVVNLLVLLNILGDRVEFYKDENQARLFSLFRGFTPGTYRKLLASGTLKQATKLTHLCRQDEPLTKLFFVVSGGVRIVKNGKKFDYMPGTFIGEVVFLSGGEASACVSVPTGATYYEWAHEPLKKLLRTNPELNNHLASLLNKDLSVKIRYN